MQCPHCNAILPDGSKYCPVCEQVIGQPVVNQNGMQGTYIPTQPAWNAPDNVYQPPEPKKPKGFPKKLIFLLVGIIAAIGLIVGVGALTHWFGLQGPASQVASALKNTAKAKSFTITIEGISEYPEYDYHYDYDTGDYISEYIGMKTVKSTATYYVVIDHKKEDIMMYGVSKNDDGTVDEFAIYDGYSISRYEYLRSDGSLEVSYYYSDVDETIDAFFESPEKFKEIKKEMSKIKPDYEEVLDILFDGSVDYDDAEDYVEFDEVKGCLKKIWNKLNNRTWLKKNLDYNTKLKNGMITHNYHITDAEFIEDLLELAEPAFANRSHYREIERRVTSIEEDVDVDLSIGIKNNKLALFELTNNYTDSEGKSGYAQTSIEISNYNKTKVDEDDLEDLLKEAKLYEEEQRAKQQSYYNDSYYNDYYYGY